MLLFCSEREISLYGSEQGQLPREREQEGAQLPWRAGHCWVMLAWGEHKCDPQFQGKGVGRVLSSLSGFQKAGGHYPVRPCVLLIFVGSCCPQSCVLSFRCAKEAGKKAAEDIKMFKHWLRLHHPSETRKIHTLPPADLDRYLISFFNSAKKQNGMDFSANSLYFFHHSIDRYLKFHNYQYNILRGPEFRASQEAFKLKHWSLNQKGKEEEWSAVENLTDVDVENLHRRRILSKAHPHGLLHLMMTNLIRGFGASTHHQPHQLYWGQVVLRKTKGEMEYLEWKDDLSPGGNEGELNPRLFAKPEDPEKCPVASYKEYARKRPLDMLSDNQPLYLSPKSLCSIWDNVWYSRKALTKAKTDKILKIIMQEVGRAIKKNKK